MSNLTKQDATARITLSKIGSLVGPADEYLDALEQELHRWLYSIKEFRWKSQQSQR